MRTAFRFAKVSGKTATGRSIITPASTYPDAVRSSTLIEPLEPYFAEDLVRSEDPGVYRELRQKVKVPIAVGEQFGSKWDVKELIENQLIDYARVTLAERGRNHRVHENRGFVRDALYGPDPALYRTYREAALVHTVGIFSGPVMMEMVGERPAAQPHLPECFDFRNGKMYPNTRPGLGITLDTKPLQLVAEITEKDRYRVTPIFERPDGSVTNW